MGKLLFIWYKRPTAIKGGGGMCSMRNYELLGKIVGAENIDSIYIHNDDKKRSLYSYISGVLYMCFGYFFGLTPKRCTQIVKQADNYDYVFIDRSVFGIIAYQLKKTGYKGKIISHFHNVESIYFDSKLNKHLPFRNVVLNNVSENDRMACQYSDKIIVLNERDSQIIETQYGRKADIIVPITLPDKAIPQEKSIMTHSCPHCLFIGSYFPANTEGLLWFVKNVLPNVNIRLTVIGKGMSKLKAKSQELKDIEVLSDVPDLASYFVDADIMILPIFTGSGMKVKTCESLMYGKNILGTHEAFEGYHIDTEQVGGECNTAQQFISKLTDFSSNPRPRFNTYSRTQYEKMYSDNAVEQLFRNLFDFSKNKHSDTK